jgi:threonine dehydrogenase-like Zn-dependent dehydrogenase
MSMLAFSIVNPGDKEGKVVTIPKPEPEPGFALIKVRRAGICNTDLEILQGYMGFNGVLGHEFVGVVEDVNTEDAAVKGLWVGKRVCGDINVGCATCSVCKGCLDQRSSQMSRNHCPNRTVLGILNRNGTMAEYLTLPVSNLHLVPEDVPDEVAVFAEPLAAACRIPEQGLIRYDTEHPDRVAILGDGKLGLMIAEVLGREHAKRNLTTAKPILFGKHDHKLHLVKSSGVDCRLISECQDDTAFNGVAVGYAGKYDVVVDATGNPAGLSLAAGLCRPMGTLVCYSVLSCGDYISLTKFSNQLFNEGPQEHLCSGKRLQCSAVCDRRTASDRESMRANRQGSNTSRLGNSKC